MEAIVEHTLEPELTAAVPRRLRLPLGTQLLLSVAAVLLALFALGSGRALWEGAKLSWLDLCGQTVSSRIVEIESEPAPPKGHLSQQNAIRYEAVIPSPQGPQPRSGWIVLSAPEVSSEMERPVKAPAVPRFYLGEPFPLRCASFLGITVCQPWGPNPGSRILTLFLAGGLVLSVCLLLLRRLLRWAGSRTHLLRHGTAVIGTITHKRSESEDMVRYFLRYGYADGGVSGRDREEQVSADQWQEFHVGQPVTVLFDPEQPARAGLYALIVSR